MKYIYSRAEIILLVSSYIRMKLEVEHFKVFLGKGGIRVSQTVISS